MIETQTSISSLQSSHSVDKLQGFLSSESEYVDKDNRDMNEEIPDHHKTMSDEDADHDDGDDDVDDDDDDSVDAVPDGAKLVDISVSETTTMQHSYKIETSSVPLLDLSARGDTAIPLSPEKCGDREDEAKTIVELQDEITRLNKELKEIQEKYQLEVEERISEREKYKENINSLQEKYYKESENLKLQYTSKIEEFKSQIENNQLLIEEMKTDVENRLKEEYEIKVKEVSDAKDIEWKEIMDSKIVETTENLQKFYESERGTKQGLTTQLSIQEHEIKLREEFENEKKELILDHERLLEEKTNQIEKYRIEMELRQDANEEISVLVSKHNEEIMNIKNEMMQKHQLEMQEALKESEKREKELKDNINEKSKIEDEFRKKEAEWKERLEHLEGEVENVEKAWKQQMEEELASIHTMLVLRNAVQLNEQEINIRQEVKKQLGQH